MIMIDEDKWKKHGDVGGIDCWWGFGFGGWGRGLGLGRAVFEMHEGHNVLVKRTLEVIRRGPGMSS